MSDDTLVADPPPAGPTRGARTTGDKIRFVLRGVGQTLITLGLVVLLFVVYEVWITNLFSRAENDRIAHKLEQVWSGNDTLALPGSGASTIPLGTGIANLYMPRLGRDFHWTIVEGSRVPTDGQLEKGPAHYGGTALPGETGNFAVAGHRVGKGEPFLNIDKLQAGDSIVVETKSWWYVYRVKGVDHGLSKPDDVDKVPGREIVNPSDGNVLLPVPDHAGQAPNEPLLTLTTCHPKFTAAQRMIIHAVLQSRTSALDAAKHHVQAMPSVIAKLYSEVKL